jgi:hypothetical protein
MRFAQQHLHALKAHSIVQPIDQQLALNEGEANDHILRPNP